ncbi:MAG TPA: restriction endonuclease subunit S [Nitrososphaeraceae archaeon]|nr:restriction endonuclease subunit S [Nitrososphaeraceae archaeon]
MTELGEIPENWDIAKLEDIALSFVSGGTPATSKNDYWNGDIPWMRSASINGRYIVSGERFISKLGLDNSASKLIPKDNLIIATRVSIGNFAINKIDIAINQDLTAILFDKKKIDLEFIYWLMFKLKEIIKSFVQGSTISGIKRDDLKELKIALPPLHEQQKISAILSNMDNLIQKLEDKKKKEEILKKGLMQQLLTGKRRVKV